MAKKLAIAVLVLIALLYSMVVPSPSDYEYEISKGLGPQALQYYKLVEGKNGRYHQVNNLLFDTGQVYPPPRKSTIPPKVKKRRKRRRKQLPSHVKKVLPNVMLEQVEAEDFREQWGLLAGQQRLENTKRESQQGRFKLNDKGNKQFAIPKDQNQNSLLHSQNNIDKNVADHGRREVEEIRKLPSDQNVDKDNGRKAKVEGNKVFFSNNLLLLMHITSVSLTRTKTLFV